MSSMDFKKFQKLEKKAKYYKMRCHDCIDIFPLDCGNCSIKQKRLAIDDKINDANIKLMTMEFFF